MFSRGLSGLRSRFFLIYRLPSKDEKPYSATFGQISSKSNEAFSIYAQKTSFLTLIPYNPWIKIFFKKTKTSLSSPNQVTTWFQKSEQSHEQFSRSLSNGRTSGRTDERKLNHKSQPLRGGPIISSLHITKLDHTTSTIWKKLTKNLQTTILSPHEMYFWPKKGQKWPKKIFLLEI